MRAFAIRHSMRHGFHHVTAQMLLLQCSEVLGRGLLRRQNRFSRRAGVRMLGDLRRPGRLDFRQILRDRERRWGSERDVEKRHSVAWMNNSWHKMSLLAKGNLEHPLIFELLEGGDDRRFL